MAQPVRRFDRLRFRDNRADLGLTQEAVARELNRSLSLIRAYESGRRSPSTAMLGQLASLLGVPVDTLLTVEAA